MKFKGLYRAWPVDQFKEGVLRERVVRALAIPPGPWQFPAKIEGTDSLKVDPLPGYLGDLAERPSIDSQDADKDREQFLEDMARHARGGETSLADTAGGEPPKSHEKHEASLAETAGGSKEKHNSKRNRSITLIRIGIHGPTKGCHACESGGYTNTSKTVETGLTDSLMKLNRLNPRNPRLMNPKNSMNLEMTNMSHPSQVMILKTLRTSWDSSTLPKVHRSRCKLEVWSGATRSSQESSSTPWTEVIIMKSLWP